MREQEADIYKQELGEIKEPPVFENGYVFQLEERGFSPEAIAIRARETFGKREGEFGKTMVEYGRLKFFNYFARLKLGDEELSEQEVNDVWREIERLNELEQQFKEDGRLATIGVEIEIPESATTSSIRRVLSNLLIPLTREESRSNKGRVLVEVSTQFSYSSQVQARVIQELLKMGLVPLDSSEDPNQSVNADNLSGYEISDDEPLSMHVNLGLGRFNSSLERYNWLDKALGIIASSVSIAFSSADRLSLRKTSIVKRIEPARPARSEFDGELQASYLVNTPRRYEIRATELRDSTVYRLLSETQSIGTAVRAVCREIMGESNYQYQNELSDRLELFVSDLEDVFSQFNVSAYSIDSKTGKEKIIDLMAKTNIKQELRLLISNFSRSVNEIIRRSN